MAQRPGGRKGFPAQDQAGPAQSRVAGPFARGVGCDSRWILARKQSRWGRRHRPALGPWVARVEAREPGQTEPEPPPGGGADLGAPSGLSDQSRGGPGTGTPQPGPAQGSLAGKVGLGVAARRGVTRGVRLGDPEAQEEAGGAPRGLYSELRRKHTSGALPFPPTAFGVPALSLPELASLGAGSPPPPPARLLPVPVPCGCRQLPPLLPRFLFLGQSSGGQIRSGQGSGQGRGGPSPACAGPRTAHR